MKNYSWQEWDINLFRTLSPLNNSPTKELIHNRLGRLYWVTKGDALYIQRFARENGPYQGRNLKFLRTLLPNARTVIDVGMNVANNTMEYATWAQDVHGFEPFLDSYEMALANVELNQHVELKGRYWDTKNIRTLHDPNYNDGWFKLSDGSFASLAITGNIHTYNIGLGEVSRSFQMEHHPKNAGHNCILTESRREKTNYDLYTVIINTLDSYNFKNVDIIKVDVEGYELSVLKGGERTIRQCRPVVQLEMVEAQAKKFGYTPQDIVDFFIHAIGNYSIYTFRGEKLPNKWVKVKGVMDYFFVPDEKINNITEDSRTNHPGMGSKIIRKKKLIKLTNESLLKDL